MKDENKNIITANTLNNPQIPVTLPKTTPDLTNYGGITGGVYDTIQGDFNLANKNLETLNTAQNTGSSDIIKLMQDMTGKATDTSLAEQTAGVDTAKTDLEKYTQQLTDLNSQASVLNREAQAIPIQIQEQFKGTGATDVGVAPIQAGKLRENALKALSIAQQADIAAASLTGSKLRLESAKEKAQQIIDLKYKPMEERLAILRQQYELNKDTLTEFDKKRTEALDKLIKKQDEALKEKKENEKSIESLKLKIIENGGDPSTITSTDYNQALNEAKGELLKKNVDIKEVGGALYAVTTTPDGKVQIKNLGVGGTTGAGVDKLYSGLNSTQATAIRGLTTKFSSEPVVTGFSTIQEGRNFANSLSNKTTNPADDQGLIYALAKALDPNSVVREGEYATAQKYSQSWVKAYGKGVTQALAGTGFLSEEARKNIKKTIESKYNASKASYDNLKKSYSTGIDKISGKSNGKDYLREYEIGVQEEMPKGTMSDRDYVEKVLVSNNIKYDDFVNTTPQGQIPVIDNSTGQIGYIPYTEFNSSTYTKI